MKAMSRKAARVVLFASLVIFGSAIVSYAQGRGNGRGAGRNIDKKCAKFVNCHAFPVGMVAAPRSTRVMPARFSNRPSSPIRTAAYEIQIRTIKFIIRVPEIAVSITTAMTTTTILIATITGAGDDEPVPTTPKPETAARAVAIAAK